MADNVPVSGGSGYIVAADDITSVLYQRVKLIHGADGSNDGDVSTTNGLPVRSIVSATGTQSIVASSATDVTILAANAARRGASVYNDSTVALYLLVGSGTSSATVFTVKLVADAYYEVPASYTGVLKGLWASATGSARVTEWTA